MVKPRHFDGNNFGVYKEMGVTCLKTYKTSLGESAILIVWAEMAMVATKTIKEIFRQRREKLPL